MSQEQVNRKLSCILSTDVVGYSRLMEENEESTVRYLEENKKLISKLIEDHNGRVVDSPGDNLLVEFSSAVNAVDCAVKIQKSGNLYIVWPPVMKKIRQTPRFKEFVREIGLLDYWKEYGWPDLCRPVIYDDFECE